MRTHSPQSRSSRRPSRRTATLTLLALLLTLLAACNTSTARRPTPTATATATASPTITQPAVYPTPPGPPFTLYYRSINQSDFTVYALRSTDLSTRWSYGNTNRIEDMALGNGVLYLGYDGFTVALDAASGTRRWTTTWAGASPSFTQSTPTLVLGAGLVFATSGATLVALRAGDGHLLWQRSYQFIGRPVVAGGVVYVTDDYYPDGNHEVAHLYALRPSDGATLWSVSIPPAGSDGFSGGRNFYYLSRDGVLHALALANGRQVWQFPLPASDTVPYAGDSLAVGDGIAYLITFQHLYAFQATSGAMRWQDDIGLQNEFSIYPTVTADGRVFLAGDIGRGGSGSFLDAINAVDGTELWLNTDNYGWTSAPIVVGDTAYGFGVLEGALVHTTSGAVFAAYTLPASPLIGAPILGGP